MILHAVLEPNMGAAFDFLTQLYSNTTDEGYVSLFHIDRQTGARATRWAALDGIEGLGESILGLAPRGDVWFGVAPRRAQLSEGRRGGVGDCVSIPAFWLDIDVASDVHKMPNLPQSYEEARQLVLSFPLAPSMVVRSGYGLQCWWRLHEALVADEALELLSRWQATWERLALGAGVHVDNTSNIDRVMRLPGTFNFKGVEPVLVTFKSGPKVYEHADVSELLDSPSPTSNEHKRTTTAHLAGSRFNEAHIDCERIILQTGCTLVRTDVNGDRHYHFPGASNETSCTLYADDGHCTIWSETMAAQYGLELRRPYDPFGLWVYVEHHGDFSLAHTVLVEKGIVDRYDRIGDLMEAKQREKVKPPERLKVTVVSASTRERVKWLWYGWLPAGKLIILDGDPDVGKSTLSIEIAARVSRGAEMPDGTEGIKASDVVLLSGEDDLEDTIVWRLLAANADIDRVHYVHAALDDEGELPVTIPRDLGLIEQLVLSNNAALVIVDVLDEYLDERVDSHKNQSVRRVLQQVRAMARRTGCAVVMLRHLRKEASPKAIYRGGGSIGIVGAARAGWAMAYHPDDESIRVLAAVKMNIAIKPRALTFKLVAHDEYPCAFVDWKGAIDLSADELLDPSGHKAKQEQEESVTAVRSAIGAIEMFLPVGKDNAVLSHELRSWVMKSAPCGERTYKQAHAQVEFGRPWQVILPDGTRGMMVWRPDPEKGDFQ
jgi:AAA domain-containing protein